MRRSYISPEYQHKRVYGTFNMVEESNFFSSKMLEIEDSISIDVQDIIYYQNLKGEQLDYAIESSLQSYIYSSITDKKENHTLILDEKQQIYQKDKNTKWILTIDLEKILKNYLFSIMKKHRSFEGIRTDMTLNDDVNISLKSYIVNNVYNRYKLKNIDLYISYNSLRNQNVLRYKNRWEYKSISNNNKMTKLQTETSIDGSIIKLNFVQDRSSQDYNFDYFFNLTFDKL
jgi:hypothetical protein